jgi:tripartite-type tricarboxylate transporter receptor subunit TctC
MKSFRILLSAVLASAVAYSSAVTAEAYPSRPISIVVPFAPGGATDTTARLLAKEMEKASGYSVIVENKAGAGGNIAASAVARSRPDGYTVLFGTSNTNGINTYAYPNLQFDAVKSFEPVGFVAENVVVLLANQSFAPNTLTDAIALMEKNPGQYSYASPGQGTVHQLAMELLKKAKGLDVLHVPYKGAGPAMIDLVAGTVPLMIGGIAPARPFIESGKVKVLGVANNRRFENLPEGVQYFSDVAPGTAISSWMGLLAPAGTPADRIQALSESLKKALASPELQASLVQQGMQAEFMDPQRFSRLIADGMPFWKNAVKTAEGNK